MKETEADNAVCTVCSCTLQKSMMEMSKEMMKAGLIGECCSEVLHPETSPLV